MSAAGKFRAKDRGFAIDGGVTTIASQKRLVDELLEDSLTDPTEVLAKFGYVLGRMASMRGGDQLVDSTVESVKEHHRATAGAAQVSLQGHQGPGGVVV